MKKTVTSIIAVATMLLAVAEPSFGGDATNEAPKAVSYVHYNLSMFSVCRLLVGVKAELGDTEKDCPKSLAKSVKDEYPKALKSAKGNAEVISLLKKYRETMLNAIASIQPLIEERKISYRLRQENAEAELTQLTNRVEMEM